MNCFRFAASAAVAVLVLPVVAASCSSSDGSASSSTSTTVSAALATASIDTVSPFQKLQGQEAMSQDENLTQFRQQQAAVATCMRDKGWEYTPEEPYDPRTDHGPEIGTSAYGPIHGYGAVQAYEIARRGQPSAAEPNSDYVNSLSDDQASHYNDDLYGVYGPDGNKVAGQEGCAQQAIAGTNPVESIPGLRDRYVELTAGIGSDPELTTARKAWYDCMVASTGPLEIDGRAISAPEDMHAFVESLVALARGAEVTAYADAKSAPQGSEGDALTNGVIWGANGGNDSVDDADLATLREREVSLWTADMSCRAETHVDAALAAAEQERVDQLIAEFPELATAVTS